ncbi:MAG TPA: hypothetical protein VH107_07780 [Lacipirellulaceae bacterium]|jgi:hypothetical protein|nr:hypothetical protein [Lacipirellulaceae bacterium]
MFGIELMACALQRLPPASLHTSLETTSELRGRKRLSLLTTKDKT